MAHSVDNNLFKPKARTNSGARSSSSILGCFGYSTKDSGGRRKNSCWFRRMRKSVLVRKVNQIQAGAKVTPKSHSLATGEISTSDEVLHQNLKHNKPRKKHKPKQEIVLEVCNDQDCISAPKNEVRHEKICSLRKEKALKTGLSLPKLQETRFEPSHNSMELSHGSSFPMNMTKKKLSNESRKDQAHEPKKLPLADKNVGKMSDPRIGLSIVIVILVIVMIWGKVCAIICTSTWLYFIPRLKKVTRFGIGNKFIQNGSTPANSNVNYEIYKKKVVLEGFLERNHRHKYMLGKSCSTTKNEVG